MTASPNGSPPRHRMASCGRISVTVAENGRLRIMVAYTVSRSPSATRPSTRSTPESQSRQPPTSVSRAHTSAGLASIRVPASKLLTFGSVLPTAAYGQASAPQSGRPDVEATPDRGRRGQSAGPGPERRDVDPVRGRRRVRRDVPRAALQQGRRPPAVSAGGVGQPDGELGQAAPELTLALRRGLPGILEDLVGVEGATGVQQPLR